MQDAAEEEKATGWANEAELSVVATDGNSQSQTLALRATLTRVGQRGGGGVVNLWFDGERARFSTDYGVTFTDQQDVVELAGANASFAGLRFAWEYRRKLTATTTYANALGVDLNLDESSDLRGEMVNSPSVRISDSLALRLSHEALWDSEPSLVAVPLTGPDGVPVGVDLLVEADTLDSTLSAALLVTL